MLVIALRSVGTECGEAMYSVARMQRIVEDPVARLNDVIEDYRMQIYRAVAREEPVELIPSLNDLCDTLTHCGDSGLFLVGLVGIHAKYMHFSEYTIIAREEYSELLVKKSALSGSMSAEMEELDLVISAEIPGISLLHSDELVLFELDEVIRIELRPVAAVLIM